MDDCRWPHTERDGRVRSWRWRWSVGFGAVALTPTRPHPHTPTRSTALSTQPNRSLIRWFVRWFVVFVGSFVGRSLFAALAHWHARWLLTVWYHAPTDFFVSTTTTVCQCMTRVSMMADRGTAVACSRNTRRHARRPRGHARREVPRPAIAPTWQGSAKERTS